MIIVLEEIENLAYYILEIWKEVSLKQIDVVIVGGGPAGATLGYLLQKKGISNCIIDKKSFPRNKLCGGLLTKKTHDLLDSIYGDTNFPYERISTNVSLFCGYEKISNVTTNTPFYFVERFDFDFNLITRYKDIGGDLRENCKIKELDKANNAIILDNNEIINYKIVVGADGANSYIRKYVDKDYRPNALCIEQNIVSKDVSDEIQIYFSAIRSGYGWCFPKRNHYTVGIGGKIDKNKDIKHSFQVFAKNIDKQSNSSLIFGASLPFGEFVKKPYLGNILLIGDAAGFVDPLTGEGIYFALYSAKCAYEAIVEKIENKQELGTTYFSKVKIIQEKIKEANRFNLLFSDFLRPFFLFMVKGKTNITKYVCDNLISEYKVSYTQFIPRYIKVRRERKKNERRRE